MFNWSRRARLPRREDCEFYHSIDLPDGETIHGFWDIRGQFEQYIGHYPLTGKSVLDVGTAGGFLAFEAEKAGAASVTALDIDRAETVTRIPFKDSLFMTDRPAWKHGVERMHLARMSNGFDYAHHKLGSNVERVFRPVESLHAWGRRFDVVIAGAILEHVADPIGAIGNLAAIADEAVIVAFTPVINTDEMRMEPLNEWARADLDYSWWRVSRGLYRRAFENMGFVAEFVPSEATYNPNRHNDVTAPTVWRRHTILARRT
jgi:SAM-dependent methyltransferase